MARKIRAKLIMELREQGMSRRRIASSRHMSMESACKVFEIAAERGIGWEDAAGLSDDDAHRLFPPTGTYGKAFSSSPIGTASTRRCRAWALP